MLPLSRQNVRTDAIKQEGIDKKMVALTKGEDQVFTEL